MNRYEKAGSGRASSGFPMRKCPEVNTSMPSLSQGRAASGLLFRHASIELEPWRVLRMRCSVRNNNC